MKVLFIAFDSAELSVRLASGLARRADVCLMVPRRSAQRYLHLLHPDVHFQPFDKPRLRQPWRQIWTTRSIVKRIKEFNPDVIHFQKQHLWFNLGLLFLRQYPVVVSIHDPRPHIGDQNSLRTPSLFWDFGYRRADRVIAHNPQMKQLIADDLDIPEEIIDIVPLVERGDPTVGEHLQEEGNLILFFGRIWRYKGLEHLIRAEPLIASRVPGAKIVIAGQGEDFTPYRQMMANPENFIVHNEYVSDKFREELFQRASVVVLPYIEATQSGVIPVAYTHGKPVVASAVGGLPTQVEDGQTGFLVPPGDHKTLAETIVRLLLDQDLCRRLGANGKKKLQSEWSADVVADRTIPVYEKAIADLRDRGETQSRSHRVFGWPRPAREPAAQQPKPEPAVDRGRPA